MFLKAKTMKEIFKKMFFKWGVQLFDASSKEYGGFNHWIAKLFGWRITSIVLSIHSEFRFEFTSCYYDGYHKCIWIGPFSIYWYI